MAIGLDGHSKGTGSGTPSTPYTLNHTCGGVQRLLVVVFTGIRGNTSSWSVSDVTYNGTSLTQAAGAENSGNNRNVRTEVWYLVNPPGGTSYEVSLTPSNGLQAYSLAAISLTGVDQTTPVGNTGTDAGNKSAFSASIATTVADAWLVGGAGIRYGTNSWSPDSGVSEIFEQSSGSSNTNDVVGAGLYRVCTSTGSYSIGATASTSERGALAAMAVNPASSEPAAWFGAELVLPGGVWTF